MMRLIACHTLPKGKPKKRRTALKDVRRNTYILLLIILASVFSPVMKVNAQDETIPIDVLTVFNKMTPDERVGQLFLVSFSGTDVSPESKIFDLIRNHYIGGVVLLSSNDNFSPMPNTLDDTRVLINELQKKNWDGSFIKTIDPITNNEHYPAYVPLFIALSQEGDGYPTDQLLSGLTPLPSQMAIGATWDPALSQKAGEVMGRELSALGVNLYLGLSLDVLDVVSPQALNDLGVRSFGGDPYWVGQMGSAYIKGLHEGSAQRMLVVAKHFPGQGGTDRSTDTEIATVRKSLEQLKQIELAPFFEVTSHPEDKLSIVDGLLVSHIRYQGFQGNIRATTRPVSFDAQALSDLLLLPQFSPWRDSGGIIISDDLGSRAVKEFYSLGGDVFSARTVARDAFLAGNDMLYLGQITSADALDNYSTVVDVLSFFSQKYREDPAFAARVDAAVIRILTRKLALYDIAYISKILTSSENLKGINISQDLMFEIARDSSTLISPSTQDLANVLPSPPQSGDRLVFITDSISVKQCSQCDPQPSLAVEALQQVVLRLYGPSSGKQTSENMLSSYSFETLQSLLNGTDTSFLGSDIDRADWVIISIVDSARDQPQLLRQFLLEKQNQLSDKRVILLSFGAPYYLDSTDISKLTAYFGLYSKQPAFIDVAARLLYQELTPRGASPVSIPGVGYDLINVTAPDAKQIISLFLDLEPVADSQALPTQQTTPVPLYEIGDTIGIRTGVIIDQNGNPVPDGTVVKFSMDLTGEGGGILQQVESVTVNGISHASFGLDKHGLLQIRVESEPAIVSELLQLDVSTDGASAVTLIVPALSETLIPELPVDPKAEENNYITRSGHPNFNGWLLITFIIFIIFGVAYWSGVKIYKYQQKGLRMAIGAALGALTVYNYFALGLFDSQSWVLTNGIYGVTIFVIVGAFLGWIIVLVQTNRTR